VSTQPQTGTPPRDTFELINAILIVRLDRPDKLNAADLELQRQVAATIEDAVDRDELRGRCQSDRDSFPFGASWAEPLSVSRQTTATRPRRPSGGSYKLAVDEMAFLVEVAVERSVNGRELLQRLHPAESLHCSFASSERQGR